MKLLYALLNMWRTLLPYGLIFLIPGKKDLYEEINYWSIKNQVSFKSHFMKFTYLVCRYTEYRNLLLYRFKRNNVLIRCLGHLFMIFLPRQESLKIYADKIGKNFYIEHGVGTIISAKEIGDNCWVNQQVTLGYNLDNKAPVIGNGVRICAGAKVLGGITLGNNVIVAASAVVVKSVDDNSIVAGIPAVKIKENYDHKLWLQEDEEK